MADFKDLIAILNKCLAPRFKNGTERPCEESDFEKFVDGNVTRLTDMKLATDQQNDLEKYYDKELLMGLLMILGENNKKFPWNNREICKLCCDLRDKMFSGILKSEQQLLMNGLSSKKSIPPLLKPILLAMRPKLLKETWKDYPAAVECFSWILTRLEPPHIADNIQHILPTALLLVDDFVNENRIIGIRCLQLIINDLTIAELKYHGYGELIYKALQGLIRERDDAVAGIVLPCILSLIKKLETDYGDVDPSYKWSRFDDTMEILLEIIGIESRIPLRKVYTSYIVAIVETMGSKTLRWSKRLLAIFDHYLDTAGDSKDYETISQFLDALKLFIELTKPVIKYYRQAVLFIIFRLLYHISEEAPPAEIHAMAMHCLRLVLSGCTVEESKVIINDVENELSFHPVSQKITQLIKECII